MQWRNWETRRSEFGAENSSLARWCPAGVGRRSPLLPPSPRLGRPRAATINIRFVGAIAIYQPCWGKLSASDQVALAQGPGVLAFPKAPDTNVHLVADTLLIPPMPHCMVAAEREDVDPVRPP